MSQKPNVGIVADWLVTYAGAERVIKRISGYFSRIRTILYCRFFAT